MGWGLVSLLPPSAALAHLCLRQRKAASHRTRAREGPSNSENLAPGPESAHRNDRTTAPPAQQRMDICEAVVIYPAKPLFFRSKTGIFHFYLFSVGLLQFFFVEYSVCGCLLSSLKSMLPINQKRETLFRRPINRPRGSTSEYRYSKMVQFK